MKFAALALLGVAAAEETEVEEKAGTLAEGARCGSTEKNMGCVEGLRCLLDKADAATTATAAKAPTCDQATSGAAGWVGQT